MYVFYERDPIVIKGNASKRVKDLITPLGLGGGCFGVEDVMRPV